jgi:hypothetical protein
MSLTTTEVALGAAIFVVLILVMSCYGCSKPKSNRRCRHRSFDSFVNNDNSQISKTGDGDTVSEHQTSRTGAGVTNRNLKNQYEDLEKLKGYDDYSEVAKYQALEPSVFESHDKYAWDVGVSNSGASYMSVKSDDNDLVNWVGLRRPNYKGVSAAKDARVQHSEYVDQMPDYRGVSY